MGLYCCVPKCKKRSGTGVSFHELPCNMDLRSKWIKNICRENWTPGDRATVCSDHFPNSCFSEDKIGRKMLKRGSIPTIFANFPKYLQAEAENRAKIRKPPASRVLVPPRKKQKLAIPVEFPEQPEIIDQGAPTTPHSRSTGPWGSNPSPRKVRRKLATSCKTILRLQRKVKQLEQEKLQLQQALPTQLSKQVAKILTDAKSENPRASFLPDQVQSYGRKWHKWSGLGIRRCVLWHAKSPRAYGYARTILRLPSYSTLKRFMGPMDYNSGMTSCIKQRLVEAVTKLSRIERECSLIFDEMAVKPMLSYVRGAGRLIGYATTGWAAQKKQLANKVLCFLVKGLSTNYRIPVAYYHTRQLLGEELAKLIKLIVKEVEEYGFRDLRLVCDNSKVNVKAYTDLCPDSKLTHEIPHFCDPTRPLFLVFDYCHILKCLRNILMDGKKRLKKDGSPISGDYVRKLYESEKSETIKQAPPLTRKVVYPNNFEKMNVKRAMALFSTEVTSSIDFQREQDNLDFVGSEETTFLMGLCRKWFKIHDVSNSTKMKYLTPDDERLQWLEHNFLLYLDSWKTSCVVGKRTIGYLTKETDQSIRITTKSTIACIKYLIGIGFEYVLTRKFSGDDIESLFSSIRQMCGSNDQTNTLSVTHALEKTTKAKFTSPSTSSNVHRDENQKLSWTFDILLEEICNPPKVEALDSFSLGASMIAGFCVRLVKDKFECPEVDKLLTTKFSEHTVYNFIERHEQRGALIYPAQTFLESVVIILKFLEKTISVTRTWTQATKQLVDTILPQVISSGRIICGCRNPDHSKRISEIIVKKLIVKYRHNYTKTQSDLEDVPNCHEKPLSRKILKL